jgi:D-xylose 1-dehydrogenase (NADP+, D-xylono-1,5-lactone-forming)
MTDATVLVHRMMRADDDDVRTHGRGLVGIAWGILSTARIGGRLIEGARASRDADVVAVGSRSEAAARRFADVHGIARAHGSYEALLADPDIEALYIPLPNAMHVEWTLRALEAGKHVLCEKPMDRRPERVARAFDLAEERGLVLSEAFMWRHNPQTVRLQALLREGAVGDVRLIRACFSFMLAGDGDVRLDPALHGGALMDVGCYAVSGARLIAGGEPLSAAAQVATAATGVDMRLTGLLGFAGDVLAIVDCGLDLPSRSQLEICGSEGRIVLADPWHCIDPKIVVERGYERAVVDVEPTDSYRLELEDMAAAIRCERAPLLGRADALGQARTIEALYRSAAAGHAVAVG